MPHRGFGGFASSNVLEWGPWTSMKVLSSHCLKAKIDICKSAQKRRERWETYSHLAHKDSDFWHIGQHLVVAVVSGVTPPDGRGRPATSGPKKRTDVDLVRLGRPMLCHLLVGSPHLKKPFLDSSRCRGTEKSEQPSGGVRSNSMVHTYTNQPVGLSWME